MGCTEDSEEEADVNMMEGDGHDQNPGEEQPHQDEQNCMEVPYSNKESNRRPNKDLPQKQDNDVEDQPQIEHLSLEEVKELYCIAEPHFLLLHACA